MLSSLPPGVTENMLPGNRPEDEAWDNLHIEIDNDADMKGLSPWDALEIWHMGIEQWLKPTTTTDNEGRAVFDGKYFIEYVEADMVQLRRCR